MFDIKKAEELARKELSDERQKAVTQELKTKLQLIEKARLVVRNLEREYDVLLAEIGDRA